MEEIPANKKTWIGFKKFFADKYHNFKLTQSLRAGQTGYNSTNNVVQTGDIPSLLDNLAITATLDQRHMDKLMKKYAI